MKLGDELPNGAKVVRESKGPCNQSVVLAFRERGEGMGGEYAVWDCITEAGVVQTFNGRYFPGDGREASVADLDDAVAELARRIWAGM